MLAITRAKRDSIGGSASDIAETDLDRIIKLIPAEVVSLYVSALALGGHDDAKIFPPVLFGVGVALVPTILWLDGRATKVKVPPLQYVLRTLAFVAWAFAIANPLAGWGLSIPSWVWGLLVLLIPLIGSRLLSLPAE